MQDVFDQTICELTEEDDSGNITDCTEVAICTVKSGDLNNSVVCRIHAEILKNEEYQVIEGIDREDD